MSNYPGFNPGQFQQPGQGFAPPHQQPAPMNPGFGGPLPPMQPGQGFAPPANPTPMMAPGQGFAPPAPGQGFAPPGGMNNPPPNLNQAMAGMNLNAGAPPQP